ncbi:hypothetical protein T265_07400 [Opisthorchis viverrini]|uniref:Uncharacterized protein n=1 Tax=Opisthorchis viverrini TaxID=6198 RepID=A0A074ZH90_OPIVI|nr:hypothetical protein T265_07400 [Opisthorchis viverrini]KER25062.1 hypothetical protein T265_07400 [Opisthorchis viverrini]
MGTEIVAQLEYRRTIRRKSHIESFSCSTLPVPSCHATRRRHDGLDTARSPKPRQGQSRGRGRVRTMNLPLERYVCINSRVTTEKNRPAVAPFGA